MRQILNITVIIILVLVLSSPGVTQAVSPLVIDSFDGEQAGLRLAGQEGVGATTSSIATDSKILGGERDVELELTKQAGGASLTTNVGAGAFSLASGPALEGLVQIVWDGPDGDPTTLNPTGLEGVDLTDSGAQDAFVLEVSFADTPVDIAVEVFSDEGNSSSLRVNLPGEIANSVVGFVLPYTDFSPKSGEGADFTNVGAINLAITVAGAPDMVITSFGTTSRLTAAKTETLLNDNDEDGQADPGDTLQYTMTIANSQDAFNTETPDLVYSDTPGANTSLVVGSVTTTQGAVVSGNEADETEVRVDIGSLAIGETATIVFEVTIDNPLPADVTEVIGQGFVSDGGIINLPTDDPKTEAEGDPTITPVFSAPAITASQSDQLVGDNNSDGQANPGDILQYTVVMTNSGDQDAVDVIFDLTPDSTLSLETGSIISTQGIVINGNEAGDTEVTVEIGELGGAGGSVSLTFEATIDESLPADITEIATQGVVSGSNFADLLTDDPDTEASADPTLTPVVSP